MERKKCAFSVVCKRGFSRKEEGKEVVVVLGILNFELFKWRAFSDLLISVEREINNNSLKAKFSGILFWYDPIDW